VIVNIYRHCIPYPNDDVSYQTEHGILLCTELTEFKQTDDMLS
jgi:plasmid rolling circle replication initiator protein Rep